MQGLRCVSKFELYAHTIFFQLIIYLFFSDRVLADLRWQFPNSPLSVVDRLKQKPKKETEVTTGTRIGTEETCTGALLSVNKVYQRRKHQPRQMSGMLLWCIAFINNLRVRTP